MSNMNNINYSTADKEIRDAWFKYKKKYPNGKFNVISFVAGYNAAKPLIKTKYCECGSEVLITTYVACAVCMQ